MSKKILAIVSSPRLGSNSEMLVDSFIRGAEEAGHEVEKLVLRGKKNSAVPRLRGVSEERRHLCAEG